MNIVVVGASGTIGAAVVKALAGRHRVIGASRRGEPQVDIEDQPSVAALFRGLSGLDAVICCAGSAAFKPLLDLAAADFAWSLQSKLMGQVGLVLAALPNLSDGGSITLTSGILAREPMPGSGAISLVNAGIEGFVRAAALEAPRGIRVNVVSPPWVKETLAKLGMDPAQGLSAADVAKAYVAAVEGQYRGETLEPARFL
jgi:NAD(P)-dependent dehydrogenase (short-subunit alcohol dehydrogenase family)